MQTVERTQTSTMQCRDVVNIVCCTILLFNVPQSKLVAVGSTPDQVKAMSYEINALHYIVWYPTFLGFGDVL